MNSVIRDPAIQSAFDALCQWAKPPGSPFADPSFRTQRRAGADTLIYRLKRWPDIPTVTRTAQVLRVLSLMSNRLVNRTWLLANTSLTRYELDRLLRLMIEDGAVELIDSSRFAPAPPQ